MNTRRNLFIFLICTLAVLGVSQTPIQPDRVTHFTTGQLTREVLSPILEEQTLPLEVRIQIQADPIEKEAIQNEIENAGKLTLTDNPEAPLLLLTAEKQRDQLVLSGSLAEEGEIHTQQARLGDWLSLLPPLIALILALVFRKVLLALFLAVFAGAWIGYDPAFFSSQPLDPIGQPADTLFQTITMAIGALYKTVNEVLWPVLTEYGNLQILGFTFALVGMIAVVNRMGGTAGLIQVISKMAKGPQQTQIATGLMGTAVFFDDYANTVVVGTTARKLTDANRISREKLAYIVDSTSAPIAGVALISTWIGYEVGLFNDLVPQFAGVSGMPTEGYGFFFAALPFRFYCFFALFLVFLSAWLKRDMGPMLLAERRCRAGGSVHPDKESASEATELAKPGAPARWYNAVIPVGMVLALIFGAIISIGSAKMDHAFSFLSVTDWRDVFNNASDDITPILFWSSLVTSVVAILLARVQGILTIKEALIAYFSGVWHLLGAGAILVLAWSIKEVCGEVGTGMAMVALIGDHLPVFMLPLIVFLLSGMVAFATGTSWGTMALILPVAIPIAVAISGEAFIVIVCLGAVLDGAIWGDHVSPISDTTVLSATATDCPLVDHVRTQAPYAFLAMFAAGSAGYLAYGLGISVWMGYPIGIALLIAGLYLFGKDPNLDDEGRPLHNGEESNPSAPAT